MLGRILIIIAIIESFNQLSLKTAESFVFVK